MSDMKRDEKNTDIAVAEDLKPILNVFISSCSSNIKGTNPVTWIPLDLKKSTMLLSHCDTITVGDLYFSSAILLNPLDSIPIIFVKRGDDWSYLDNKLSKKTNNIFVVCSNKLFLGPNTVICLDRYPTWLQPFYTFTFLARPVGPPVRLDGPPSRAAQ